MELTFVFLLGTLLAAAAALPALAIRSHLGRRLREEKQQDAAWTQRVAADGPDASFKVDEGGCIRSFNGAAERLFGYTRDLSGRNAAGRNARFPASLLDCIGFPVLVLDTDARVVWHNRAFEELTGYGDAAASGRQFWELLYPIEEWSRIKLILAQLFAGGGRKKGEFEWRRSTGETVRVYIVMTAMDAGTSPAARAVVAAFQVPTPNGGAVPNPMEAAERLAGSIAQQFNDLLTAVNGYSELVLHSMRDDDPARRDVEEIKQAGERATALTSQLLAFSGRQPMKTGVFNVNTLIGGMKSVLGVLLGDRIQLSTTLDPELGDVNADAGWIEQVILNLAVNARDSMPNGGKLTIETANVSFAVPVAQLTPGEYVVITVSDTGAGIDPAIRHHLFEPFFTTKASGKGIGLGLSTVHGVVRQSGGNVRVQSIPGSGATFRIYLPRYTAARDAEQAARGFFLVRGASAGGS